MSGVYTVGKETERKTNDYLTSWNSEYNEREKS